MTNSATSGLADHAEATIILTVLHQVLGEVHAGVLPLNRADLAAAGPLLEAERHVIVVPLGPDDQGLLLLLVCGVRMDLRLEQRVGDDWRDKLAFHMDGWKWRTSYLSQDFRSHIEDTSTLNLI